MKTRSGFVSNSSSASFVIPVAWINRYQVDELLKYGKDEASNEDGWDIQLVGAGTSHERISGFTIMDNDAIGKFFSSIGIPPSAVIFEDSSY